jgi:hypothetical protein
MNEVLYKAVEEVSDKKEYAFVNESCGANENSTVFDVPVSFPAKVSLTYWVGL